MPKGKIRNEQLPLETAIGRVEYEAGLKKPRIVSSAGETSYEFYSTTRNQPVCNKIVWYIMEPTDDSYAVNKDEGFLDGGFYSLDTALDMITYSQDKSLVSLSYKRYLEFKNYEEK